MIFPPLGKVTSAVVKAKVIAAVFNWNGTLSATAMVNAGADVVLIVPPSAGVAAVEVDGLNLSVEVAKL